VDDYQLYMLGAGFALGFLTFFTAAMVLGVIAFMRRMIG